MFEKMKPKVGLHAEELRELRREMIRRALKSRDLAHLTGIPGSRLANILSGADRTRRMLGVINAALGSPIFTLTEAEAEAFGDLRRQFGPSAKFGLNPFRSTQPATPVPQPNDNTNDYRPSEDSRTRSP